MSQYGACTHCGSNLTPEDFQKPACRYCGTAFLHHQQAAAKVAELHAVMGMMRPPMPPGVAPAPGQLVVVPGMAPPQPGAAWAGAGVQGVAGVQGAMSPPPVGGPVGGGPVGAWPPPGTPVTMSTASPMKLVLVLLGVAVALAALVIVAAVVALLVARG